MIKDMKLDKDKYKWEAKPKTMKFWNPSLRASDDESTINIYEQIGYDPFDDSGMTTKIVSSVLRKNDGAPITVNINSYGGDMFEGFAIYNLLKDYEGEVTIKVIGIAASAASLIAMAGDNIVMAENSMLMIHNAWSIIFGNQHDMRESAEIFAMFDEQQARTYSAKTGISIEEITKMLDNETYLKAEKAIELGFADTYLDEDVREDEKSPSALRKADTALAKSGMTRTDRRDLLKELTSTPSAANNTNVTPSANDELIAPLKGLVEMLNQLVKEK